MKPTTVEMKVDTVGSMSKTGAKCVLKGEKEINGILAKFSLTVTGEDAALFKDININSEDNVIDVVLREPAQQQLGD